MGASSDTEVAPLHTPKQLHVVEIGESYLLGIARVNGIQRVQLYHLRRRKVP
jgi:hypothetical protein